MLTVKDIREAIQKMEEQGWSPYFHFPTWEELTEGDILEEVE